MRLLIPAFAAAAACLLPLPALAQDGAVLTPERVFADPDLNGPRARGVSLSPDGELVAWLRGRDEDQNVLDLWAAPVAGGEPYRLVDARALVPDEGQLSEAERARRERMRISQQGVVEYAWDRQGRYVLAPLGGDLFLAERADGTVRRLTETEADEIDAKVSPHGRWVSFVRAQNLVLLELETGAETPVTTDGGGTLSWASAEFIAQEEMDRDTGYWWSPDERRIALARVDESGVDVIPRFDIGAAGGTVVEQRYPRAGRPNAVVDLFVHDLETGRRVEVDLGDDDDIYLARVDWSADGSTLYVQRQSRDQRTLDLLAADPATGATRVILTQGDDNWVDLTHDFRALADGRFIWSSEASGWRHLYLYEADGTLVRPITHGDWAVKALEGVNEQTGEVFFTASFDGEAETPITQHLWRASYAEPSGYQRLTEGDGWWTANVNRTGTAFVGAYSDPTTPPRTALYAADGSFARWIEQNRLDEAHPYFPYLARHRTPEHGELVTEGGHRLMWQMTTPADFDPARRYPVVVQVYGGPSGGGVRRSWQPLTTRLLNEAGYVVFRLDNRGEGHRSEPFKTALHLNLGGVEVEDQLLGLAHLRSLPFVDGERIAVQGWSYGGFMTLMLMTDPRADLAAGISGAPPTEWGLYDTHYTERFMGAPESNPAGYAASDVIARLPNLEGRLLLMHGMADDNVIFENTTRVLEALQQRGVVFETMLYPGQRHGIRGNAKGLHQWRTYLDFLDRTIGDR